MRKVLLFLLVGALFPTSVGCNRLPSRSSANDSVRILSLGTGLEPEVKEILPGTILFSYRRTNEKLYEVREGKRVWLQFDVIKAQETTLAGMANWKNSYPKAKILEVQPVGKGSIPTTFLVRYEE